MPRIELFTTIHAPIERVFDLARSIDLHSDSLAGTGERAVGGVTAGLIGPGETVTWRARHFGVWQHLTSRITSFERPVVFTPMLRREQIRVKFRDDFDDGGSRLPALRQRALAEERPHATRGAAGALRGV